MWREVRLTVWDRSARKRSRVCRLICSKATLFCRCSDSFLKASSSVRQVDRAFTFPENSRYSSVNSARVFCGGFPSMISMRRWRYSFLIFRKSCWARAASLVLRDSFLSLSNSTYQVPLSRLNNLIWMFIARLASECQASKWLPLLSLD